MESQDLIPSSLLKSGMARRELIGVSTSAVVAGFFSRAFAKDAPQAPGRNRPSESRSEGRSALAASDDLVGFSSVDRVLDPQFDGMRVAKGYTARAIFSWGDPVLPGALPWQVGASAEDQLKQAGQCHDGMQYFPINGSAAHGLLVINHEYVLPETIHEKGTSQESRPKPLADVRKEQAAVGISIIEIKKDKSGNWSQIHPSSYARRIHAHTPIALHGPARGHRLMQTGADPSGTSALGTLGNCSMGLTPWGTYLTCEENFQDYFSAPGSSDSKTANRLARYGIGRQSVYGWEIEDHRFAGIAGNTTDYQNEPNRFGWVVEINPFDPQSIPKKRTAMGRFYHENVATHIGSDGSMAFYMGDDARGEYIYKFVPKYRLARGVPVPADVLDDGTLYVARFDDDGSGSWIALEHGTSGLTKLNGFSDQAEVLMHARSASDHVGATPMDRPEWIAIHPNTSEIFVSLTNNTKRGNGEAREELNGPNPRPNNLYGQILKITEQDSDPNAKEFSWELFLLAGNPENSDPKSQGNILGDVFACPDGLHFDQDGRLWIETDFDDADPNYAYFGRNQLLCANPETAEVRRFFVGPCGAEITGITQPSDGKTMFINVQHPGLSFPASDGKTRPRCSTIVIQKDDGGVIGT